MPPDVFPFNIDEKTTRTANEFPIPFDGSALLRLCETYRIAELSLFGSVTRDDFDPARSDVDVLVEFLPDTPVRGFGFYDELSIFTLEEALEEMFQRKVDLIRKEGLDRYLKDEVMHLRLVVYQSSDNGGALFMAKGRGPGEASGGSKGINASIGADTTEGDRPTEHGDAASETSTDQTPGKD